MGNNMALVGVSVCLFPVTMVMKTLYGLLSMAKLAEPLLVVIHTGKVPNWKVAKSQIVHALVLVLVLALVLEKSLFSHNSVRIVGFALKIAPIDCAY